MSDEGRAKRYAAGVGELVGYARCSTVLQDLTAQREILASLGVPQDRIYLDKGLTGTDRARPDLDQALAPYAPGTSWSSPNSTGSPAPSPRLPPDPHAGQEPAGHHVRTIEVPTWRCTGWAAAARPAFIALAGVLDQAFPRAKAAVQPISV